MRSNRRRLSRRSLGEGGQTPCTTNVVYILIDTTTETHRYAGSTQDLSARLAKHNAGEVPHTTKFKPWKIEAYFAFETKEKAVAFEAYLKTGSGHAFAKRHF
ncbi:MAG: GIY-YIG nuclease family protein [Lentisphaeria bacterium]|nr:GIY-YIG nuclease family protein [Lentisphaeria bacterium]